MEVTAMLVARRYPLQAESRRGFTLLEMLIVLGILAALTMLAVESLGPVEQQARMQQTQRLLDSVKQALLATNQVGGSTVVSGFVADMGFLPDLTSPQTFVNDLSQNSGLLGPVRPYYPIGGLPYGWRGPYLQTALSTTQLVDGWGRPLAAQICDGTGTPKSQFTSLSDRLVLACPGAPDGSTTPLAASISAGMLSASRLTVNLYGVDAQGHRLNITSGVFGDAPQFFLQGGIDPISGTVVTLSGTFTCTTGDTDYRMIVDPPFPLLLVGARALTITANITGTGYVSFIPTTPMQLNLIPGTSPVIDVLAVRGSAAPTTTGGSTSGSGM